ncbi:MAG: pre-peptidase C-terminal domain-containing protein, partial [Luteimonas sp.]|nr:pre-peptidase C-terminal domain-containing protein [Luteimonas sp.]
MNRSLLYTALLAAGLMQATVAHAGADIMVVNLDAGTGQGLDDPTPATPIGGNPGTTRGDQAKVVFQFAADLWGSVLQSNVPIYNTVTFQPLTCTETSGVLGSSGTNYIFAFNSPAPEGAIADTWYHSALTDALLGADASVENGDPPGTPDIISRFNGKLGQPGCLSASGWYFGIDGNAPDNQISLLDVIMHEMSHGLGFSGFNNLATGAMQQGRQDIYSVFVQNNSTGKAWTAMTDAERQASAIDDTHLVFTGTNVKDEASLVLDAEIALEVTSPTGIAGEYAYNAAQFGSAPAPANFSGEVAISSGNDNLGCNVGGVATPVPGVSGKLALLDRGTCAFVEKAANAQAGGATGLILANNVEEPIIPAGEDASVTIPVIGVVQSVGTTFKANLPVTAGMVQKSSLSGADDDGNVLLYAPTTLAQGSSFSHYDTRLTMNALMEPFINDSLSADVMVDLTPALFKDIGWTINGGNQMLLACDTGVPISVAGGIIAGANIYASAKAFAGGAVNLLVYRDAIRGHVDVLGDTGVLTPEQHTSTMACLTDETTTAQFEEWGNGDSGEPCDPETEDCGPTGTPLTNKVPVGGLTGTAGSEVLYSFEAQAGAVLSIMTYGGRGNVSVYVSLGEEPTADVHDSKSTRAGNSETVRFTAPQAGTYFIKLTGTYSGLTLVA